MYISGDYVVCLPEPKKCPVDSDNDGGSGFLANYIYKIRNISEYSTYQILWDGNQGCGIYDNSVRYATEEEIEEYDKLDKPFDVTTLIPFKLPQNWHIIVTEENAEDVLKWRFEDNYNYRDKINLLRQECLVGITKEEEVYYSKGHNLKQDIVGDTYDFGIEITYAQFKKHVLNKQVEDYSYLIKLFKRLNIK